MNRKLDLAKEWQRSFELYATDLYPGRYDSMDFALELADQACEIDALVKQKDSIVLIHNYQYPEFHELRYAFPEGDRYPVGDSLNLSLLVKDRGPKRVDFQSVSFMASTAKIIAGDRSQVFSPDRPEVLGCSLVFGTDHDWILEWKRNNPKGVMITYINSDVYLKSLCDYVSTSANTDKIIARAVIENPGQPVLVLPDKFLGQVMKMRAIRLLENQGVSVNENLIQIYTQEFEGNNACCYVHEKIGKDAALKALDLYPDAELMIHPECGCSATCLQDLELKRIDPDKAFFLSTEGMFNHARQSKAKKFIVATEKGMVYRLRRDLADLGKEFIPINDDAMCDYMKANTFPKALRTLQTDRLEMIFCNDCCDPRNPVVTDKVIHIQRSIADKAMLGINRMLEIV